MNVKKNAIIIFIQQNRCQQDSGAGGRLKYSCSEGHITVRTGECNYNKSASILK